MYKFVKTTVDDVNIIKIKSHNERPRDLRQSYIWSIILKQMNAFRGILDESLVD